MENKKDNKLFIIIGILIIIIVLLVAFLLNIDKESKYQSNDSLEKYKDTYLGGTFYYDKNLETNGMKYAGLNMESGKIIFKNKEPIVTISYTVIPIMDTKESFIDEFIEENEQEGITHKSTQIVKISKLKPIEATKLEFSNSYNGKSVTYIIFDNKNAYYFNYVSAKVTEEIEEFKTMLDTFVLE